MNVFDRDLEPQHRFLCLLVQEKLSDDAVESYLAIGDDAAWSAAESTRITSIVAHGLMNAIGRENVPPRWHQAHDEISRRIAAYMAELDRVANRLAEAGIPLVALKNSGIVRGIYTCPGCSPMGDVDVLVESRHFRAAHQMLLGEGYKFEFRSPLEIAQLDDADRSGSAEYRTSLPNGENLWFELHRRPVCGRWLRPDQEPSAEELMERSIPVQGSAVRLLSPEDNLLQVSLHTAKHSYVRAPGFRLNLDVDRIVRHQKVDWDLFLKRVVASQVKTPVFFSLAIPSFLWDTPIPNGVLATLAPRRWKQRVLGRWLQRVGLFDPDQRKFSNPGFMLFTALLYDDLRGLGRAVFPDGKWMRERYGFDSHIYLPVYHLRRLVDLTLRRTL